MVYTSTLPYACNVRPNAAKMVSALNGFQESIRIRLPLEKMKGIKPPGAHSNALSLSVLNCSNIYWYKSPSGPNFRLPLSGFDSSTPLNSESLLEAKPNS